MRPSLNLGGVDFLLYAESPDLRHAAFAVIVVPSSTNRSICDFTAHLRVASSVAKVSKVFYKSVIMTAYYYLFNLYITGYCV